MTKYKHLEKEMASELSDLFFKWSKKLSPELFIGHIDCLKGCYYAKCIYKKMLNSQINKEER